jgi:hypothetical protein
VDVDLAVPRHCRAEVGQLSVGDVGPLLAPTQLLQVLSLGVHNSAETKLLRLTGLAPSHKWEQVTPSAYLG